ncbi:FHA domain-containing protein [Chondromyces crocatus]|uniref:Phosphopeptide-binding protein n=1 Tax=Chondromyces crocatus TaxID=52 RepID=A0A0K1EC82_CHOCO|nr:FHA domain-containing protein [Chondromyces crocatus]AKT38491.1 phosphopeptide-binding protein [Chondromyces crocatus]
MTDLQAKRPRSFQCRDILWEAIEQMSGELECSVDYLLNEAVKQYVRQRGQRLQVVMHIRDEPAAEFSPGHAGQIATPTPPPLQPPPTMQPEPPHAQPPLQPQMSPTMQPSAVPGPGQIARQPTPPRLHTPPPPMAATPTPPPIRAGAQPTPPPMIPPGGPTGMAPPRTTPPPADKPTMTPYAPQARPMERPTATNVQMGPPPPSSAFSAQPRYPSMAGAPGAMTPPPSAVGSAPYGTPPAGGGLPPPPMPSSALQREPTMAPPAPAPSSSPPLPGGAQVPSPPLYVLYGGQRMQVNKDRFIIGRGKQAVDLTIKDPNISRQHAMVEFSGGQYYVVDLGSTNGIEQNGARISRKVLIEGDLIRICDHELRFTYR